MGILTPEFMNFLQIIITIAAAYGAYRAGLSKVNEVKKAGEERSQTNSEGIESLKSELKEEREARKAAQASINEWKEKHAESEKRIHALEERITNQDKEIAAHKREISSLLEENRDLHSQVDLERGLRLALQQRMDAEDNAMTKALKTVTEIFAPFVQIAVTNSQSSKNTAPVAEPVGAQPA